MDSRGYAAAYQHLESLTQGFESSTQQQAQQQQQQASFHNNPCLAGYNPSLSVAAPATAADMTGYRRSSSAVQQQQQQQQPHHSLLVSVAAVPTAPSPYEYAPHQHQHQHQPVAGVAAAQTAMTLLNVPPHVPQQPPPQQATTTHHLAHSLSFSTFDPLPLSTTPPPAGQAGGHHRTSSLEEFLLLNEELLSSQTPPPAAAAAAPLVPLLPHPPVVSSSSSSCSPHHHHHNNNNNNININKDELWLQELKLNIPALSLEPLSALQVVERLRQRMDDVVTRYIPCVDFLVSCQQELRKGVAYASSSSASSRQQQHQHYHHHHHHHRKSTHHRMTAREFYANYVHHLPQQFQRKNQFVMQAEALDSAMQGLVTLAGDARQQASAHSNSAAHHHSSAHEAVKNSFLGGMKDGESWGLRKWLSQHGNALRICTDVECVSQCVQKLERSCGKTKHLCELLRPLAQQTLDRLQRDVPASYQAHSSAHPYLPFFHRLEAALRAMAQYDPDDDDVICIDDDDDDDDEAKAPAAVKSTTMSSSPSSSKKRKARRHPSSATTKRPVRTMMEVTELLDDDDDDGDDEYEQQQPVRKGETATGTSTAAAAMAPFLAATTTKHKDGSSSSGESEGEEESVIEIVGVKQPAAVAAGMDGGNNNHHRAAKSNSTSGSSRSSSVDNTSSDWKCPSCLMLNVAGDDYCLSCGEPNFVKDLVYFPGFDNILNGFQQDDGKEQEQEENNNNDFLPPAPPPPPALWPIPLDAGGQMVALANVMANNLEQLAVLFEQNQQAAVRPPDAPFGNFWDGERYARALRLFGMLCKSPEGPYFVERVDEDRLIQAGNPPFSHVIKHPLSFRDIVTSLLQNGVCSNSDTEEEEEEAPFFPIGSDGNLPVRGLSSWNMWQGMDLLQAIDLVFLNSLAYGKAVEEEKRSAFRSKTNKLRKSFWNGITQIIDDNVVSNNNNNNEMRKSCMPTRRSESSGFVVYKIKER